MLANNSLEIRLSFSVFMPIHVSHGGSRTCRPSDRSPRRACEMAEPMTAFLYNDALSHEESKRSYRYSASSQCSALVFGGCLVVPAFGRHRNASASPVPSCLQSPLWFFALAASRYLMKKCELLAMDAHNMMAICMSPCLGSSHGETAKTTASKIVRAVYHATSTLKPCVSHTTVQSLVCELVYISGFAQAV